MRAPTTSLVDLLQEETSYYSFRRTTTGGDLVLSEDTFTFLLTSDCKSTFSIHVLVLYVYFYYKYIFTLFLFWMDPCYSHARMIVTLCKPAAEKIYKNPIRTSKCTNARHRHSQRWNYVWVCFSEILLVLIFYMFTVYWKWQIGLQWIIKRQKQRRQNKSWYLHKSWREDTYHAK